MILLHGHALLILLQFFFGYIVEIFFGTVSNNVQTEVV